MDQVVKRNCGERDRRHATPRWCRRPAAGPRRVRIAPSTCPSRRQRGPRRFREQGLQRDNYGRWSRGTGPLGRDDTCPGLCHPGRRACQGGRGMGGGPPAGTPARWQRRRPVTGDSLLSAQRLPGQVSSSGWSSPQGMPMGMNMVTIASEAAAEAISGRRGHVVSLSGNFCTDKKPAAVNLVRGRGRVWLLGSSSLMTSSANASRQTP